MTHYILINGYIYIIDGDIKCTYDCVDDRKVDGDGIHGVDRYNTDTLRDINGKNHH